MPHERQAVLRKHDRDAHITTTVAIASALGTHPSDLLSYRTRDVLDTLHVCWVVPTMNGIMNVGIGIGRSQGCMRNEIHIAGRGHEDSWPRMVLARTRQRHRMSNRKETA